MYKCQDPRHEDPPDAPLRLKGQVERGTQMIKKIIKVRHKAYKDEAGRVVGKGTEIEREIAVCQKCADRIGESIIAEIEGVKPNA